jgi:histidinol-phosphate aminotransferase
LRDDFTLPDDFADRLNAAGCRLALVVNPHAPSGLLRPLEQLDRLARRFKGVLLIDEAYVDFADHDAIALLAPGTGIDNVLLLRSLSKGYSLAGLRFGYGLGHRDLITALQKARDSYNTDILAQTAATAALEHRDDAARSWKAVKTERHRLTEALIGRGCRVYASQSNFLLVQPPPEHDARGVYESLKARDIFVRYFNQPRLTDKLRITVGTPQQTDHLLDAMDGLGFTPGAPAVS